MKNKILLINIIILIFLGLIYYVVIYHIGTDVVAHASFIVAFFDKKMAFPTNFLYYLTVYIISFFSQNIDHLLKSSLAAEP